MKVFHLLSSFRYGGAARQAMQLAQGLCHELEQVFCVLGDTGPWANVLSQAGIPVKSLRWTRAADPMPLWRLRSLVHDERPDLVHVWGLPALRSLAIVAKSCLEKTVVSRAVPPQMGRLKWKLFDRWLLGRVRWVAARCGAERAALGRLGIPSRRIVSLPLATGIAAPSQGPRGRREIVCLGPLSPCKGFTQSLWAADYLQYATKDVHVTFVGAGPEEAKLRRFRATTMVFPRGVEFMGEVPEPYPLLSKATVGWVPSLTNSGLQAAVEAQAAGCPVIVSDAPLVADLIRHGETGLVFPRGNRIALARATHKLLLDEDRCARLADNARRHARTEFALEALLDRGRALYAA